MVPTPTFSNPAAGAGGNSNTNEKDTNGNAYEEALSQLRPLQPVLWGFNHRNRNQHRRAAWWGAFGMLRRRVDKVVEELASTAALLTSISKSSNSAAKSKKRKRVEEEQQEREEKVRGHVRWLRDVLVPKCYLAFSQLTADNQFATLGVVLLGALAQINAACAGLIGDDAPSGQDTDASALGLATSNSASIEGCGNSGGTKSLAARVRSDRIPGDEGPGQGGAVISRDEVAKAEKLRRKKQKLEGDSGSRLESPSTSDPTKEDRKRGGGDIAFKAKAKEVKNALGKEDLKPVKKKKKAKKGGDEFDDLFKGLF